MKRLLLIILSIFFLASIVCAKGVYYYAGETVTGAVGWSCPGTNSDILCDDFDGGADLVWSETETNGTITFQNDRMEIIATGAACWASTDYGSAITTHYTSFKFTLVSESLGSGGDDFIAHASVINGDGTPAWSCRIIEDASNQHAMQFRHLDDACSGWISTTSAYDLALSTEYTIKIAYTHASVSYYVYGNSDNGLIGTSNDVCDRDPQYWLFGEDSNDAAITFYIDGFQTDDDTMPTY